MFVKQISIFAENKPGRIAKVTQLLSEHQVDIRALSIADTRDYGILRLIVSNPDEAVGLLKQAGLTVSLTHVLAISLKDELGSLAKVMSLLVRDGVSIEYLYSFIGSRNGRSCLILRVDAAEKAIESLQAAGVEILRASEIYNM